MTRARVGVVVVALEMAFDSCFARFGDKLDDSGFFCGDVLLLKGDASDVVLWRVRRVEMTDGVARGRAAAADALEPPFATLGAGPGDALDRLLDTELELSYVALGNAWGGREGLRLPPTLDRAEERAGMDDVDILFGLISEPARLVVAGVRCDVTDAGIFASWRCNISASG